MKFTIMIIALLALGVSANYGSSYGSDRHSGYGHPHRGYGHHHRHHHHHRRLILLPISSYGDNAGTSESSYGMKQESYSASVPVMQETRQTSYNSPVQAYQAQVPMESYSAPASSYSAPASSYSAPASSYSAPSPAPVPIQSYSAPSPAMEEPLLSSY